jgi:hypothetical protein
LRVRRQPKGPGKSIDVVRRPVLLRVCRGPLRPPVVMDQERLLRFSRTPGRMRKLLRNVSGMDVSFRYAAGTLLAGSYAGRDVNCPGTGGDPLPSILQLPWFAFLFRLGRIQQGCGGMGLSPLRVCAAGVLEGARAHPLA